MKENVPQDRIIPTADSENQDVQLLLLRQLHAQPIEYLDKGLRKIDAAFLLIEDPLLHMVFSPDQLTLSAKDMAQAQVDLARNTGIIVTTAPHEENVEVKATQVRIAPSHTYDVTTPEGKDATRQELSSIDGRKRVHRKDLSLEEFILKMMYTINATRQQDAPQSDIEFTYAYAAQLTYLNQYEPTSNGYLVQHAVKSLLDEEPDDYHKSSLIRQLARFGNEPHKRLSEYREVLDEEMASIAERSIATLSKKKNYSNSDLEYINLTGAALYCTEFANFDLFDRVMASRKIFGYEIAEALKRAVISADKAGLPDKAVGYMKDFQTAIDTTDNLAFLLVTLKRNPEDHIFEKEIEEKYGTLTIPSYKPSGTI